MPSPERPLRTLMIVTAVASVMALGALTVLVSIFERKQEARTPFVQVVDITDTTGNPEVWGQNFPQHYDAYLRTTDQVRTRYGGSEALPRTPTDADPRSIVAQSKIEEDDRLTRMWAGYGFARDFREERGHAFMLEDQTFTGRQAVPQPGTCLHCHASLYLPYTRLGEGDLILGFERMNPMPWEEASSHVDGPIGCIDCHEPVSMRLRVTRPGFIEGIRDYKASVEGVPGYDVNQQATRQEMRTYVCAQCHVEYYFRGTEKRLVYPWTNGLKADDIFSYYEAADFADWTHADTGARVLKAQHPEFELWSQGVHARSGVSCADCHMPFQRVGAQKISDHHVRSPLLNVDNACRTCHPIASDELIARAEQIQENTYRLRNVAMDALMDLIADLEAARVDGRTDEDLAAARAMQRRAQFYIDFVEAENSTGFHAPHEAARVLGEAMNYARQGQITLRDPAFTPRIADR